MLSVTNAESILFELKGLQQTFLLFSASEFLTEENKMVCVLLGSMMDNIILKFEEAIYAA